MAGLKDWEGIRARADDLFRACQQSTEETALVDSCETLFRFLRDKKLKYRLPFFFAPSGSHSTAVEGNDIPISRLLTHAFENFLRMLFELLDHNEVAIQSVAATFLFRVVRHEAQVHLSLNSDGGVPFPLSIFQNVFSRILQKREFSASFQDFLVSDFLGKYDDLRYYSLKVVQKILREFAGRKSHGRHANIEDDASSVDRMESVKDQGESCLTMEDDLITQGDEPTEWYYWREGEYELSRRVTSLLLKYPAPTKISCSRRDRKRRMIFSGAAKNVGNSDDDGVIDRSALVVSNDDVVESVSCYVKALKHSKALGAGSYRLVYQNTWLPLLLELAHDNVTTQLLLEKVPKAVMPHISNPLLLTEFFLNSFNDETKLSLGILALSGMFFLVVKHRLGDPDLLHNPDLNKDSTSSSSREAASACVHFYQRLYQLITPASFSPKFRVRFLRLLNLALRSDLLPTSLVASFIKKCCRVACLVSPAASLSLTVLVYSLLEKYYSTCKALINLPDHVAARLRVGGDTFPYDDVKIRRSEQLDNVEESVFGHHSWDAPCSKWDPMHVLVKESTPEALQVEDDELSPLIIKEAKMSLWEVDLLLRHAVAAVRQISQMFESDMGKPTARKADVDDFLDMSTGTLLSQEMKYMVKLSGSSSVAFETQQETAASLELYEAYRSVGMP